MDHGKSLRKNHGKDLRSSCQDCVYRDTGTCAYDFGSYRHYGTIMAHQQLNVTTKVLSAYTVAGVTVAFRYD